MTSDQITIPAFVPSALRAAGLSFEDLLNGAGIAALPFHGGNLRVTTAQFFALWNCAIQTGLPPDFGLRLPETAATHQFDVASVAALHSENFGEALSKLARYKRLTCPEDIQVVRRGEEAHIQIVWVCADSATPAPMVDGAFAWLHMLAATGAGQVVTPLRIELTRSETNEAMLREHFGCPIQFGAAANSMVFPAHALQLPFSTYNQQMLDLMIPGLEDALKVRAASASIGDHVRAILLKGMRGSRPSIEQVAGELCVSPRTLQRRLESEGTSYQRILDDVRKETACRLLSATDLEPGEIAFVLGFEELNSFTRAFNGWEGTSPSRWRSTRAAASHRSAAH